jgi:CBS domain-containing protein
MKSIRQILRSKEGTVLSVSPETSVYEALGYMAEKNVGALLVLQDGKLAGIFSERDYARKVILKGKSSLKTPVRDIMTERVRFVRPDQTVEECMALMTEKHVRHLPVLEGDEVIGVLSIGDLVKATLEEKDFMIKQLENYITGNR